MYPFLLYVTIENGFFPWDSGRTNCGIAAFHSTAKLAEWLEPRWEIPSGRPPILHRVALLDRWSGKGEGAQGT